jgi:hypothetical protein
MSYEASVRFEERAASLFQPDTLLPAQYFEALRNRAYLEPEKRLMLAVLEEGVACFQKYVSARDSRGTKMFREAEDWILEKKGDWLFSFENICEVLGFSPQYVRQGLLRWKRRKLAEISRGRIHRLKRGKMAKKHLMMSRAPPIHVREGCRDQHGHRF